jgi:hypothetical protein
MEKPFGALKLIGSTKHRKVKPVRKQKAKIRLTLHV